MDARKSMMVKFDAVDRSIECIYGLLEAKCSETKGELFGVMLVRNLEQVRQLFTVYDLRAWFPKAPFTTRKPDYGIHDEEKGIQAMSWLFAVSSHAANYTEPSNPWICSRCWH
jgi:hypothetical protein